MQSDRSRGADVLVRVLVNAGVRYLFTVSGNHIMSIFDATLGTSLRLIHTRHEAAAVYMADAYGRLTGEPGVALVTGGPGHANALSALFTAGLAESPVVLLSGHSPHSQSGRGAFQELHQAAMAQPVTKASWTVKTGEQLSHDVSHALQIASSGRPGPVYIGLPNDILDAQVDPVPVGGRNVWSAQKAPLSSIDAETIIGWLRDATRPIVLIGPIAFTAKLRDSVRQLEDSMHVPVIGMDSPRGVNDPRLGKLGAMLPNADRILLLCKRMDFTLRFGAAFSPICEFLQIDPERVECERTARAVGARLVGHFVADPVSATEMLIAAGVTPSRHAAWSQEISVAIGARASVDARDSSPKKKLTPAAACRPLQSIFDHDSDAVMVADGGEFGQWAQACLVAPHRIINGPAGAIGGAIPMAIAARLVYPNSPIIAFSGDGAFGFHVAEYETALRHRLPFIAVVGNDARWNAEYQIQLRNYGQTRLVGCDLLPIRYDLVVAGFGAHGEHVDDSAQMVPAVTRAWASGIASCINVAIKGLPAPTFN